jgi:hypothetical protein
VSFPTGVLLVEILTRPISLRLFGYAGVSNFVKSSPSQLKEGRVVWAMYRIVASRMELRVEAIRLVRFSFPVNGAVELESVWK